MKLPFDKIYCLQLAENKDRYIESKKQFANVGILDQVEYWWTCRRSFSHDCSTVLPNLHSTFYDMMYQQNPNTYASVFNCAIEHYTMIKQALIRGFEHILIFEDDVTFTVNQSQFDIAIQNIPVDYDLILFQNNHRLMYSENTFYEQTPDQLARYVRIEHPKHRWPQQGTMAYALSKYLMQWIIEYSDQYGLSYSDRFLYEIDRQRFVIYEPACKIVEPKGNSTINEDLYK